MSAKGKRRFPRWQETKGDRWQHEMTLTGHIPPALLQRAFSNIDITSSLTAQHYYRDELQLLSAMLYMFFHAPGETHALTLNLDKDWQQRITTKNGLDSFRDALRKLLRNTLDIEMPLYWFAVDSTPETGRLHIQGAVNLPHDESIKSQLITALENSFGAGLKRINPETNRPSYFGNQQIVKLESMRSPDDEYKKFWCWPAYCLGDSTRVLEQLPYLKKVHFIADNLIEPTIHVYDFLAKPGTLKELPFPLKEPKPHRRRPWLYQTKARPHKVSDDELAQLLASPICRSTPTTEEIEQVFANFANDEIPAQPCGNGLESLDKFIAELREPSSEG